MGSSRRSQGLMDIRHILSHEQISGVEGLTINSETEDVAAPGILTKTLVHSPVIKRIFAAQIRQDHCNDIVLIRERCIEIQQCSQDGHLEEVALKADLEGSVKAAEIVGASRTLNTSMSPDDDIKSDESLHAEVNKIFKVPPQMLALILESRSEQSLLILFAFHDDSQAIRFASFKHPTSPSIRPSRKLGGYLAIDPQSRALAVPAQEGRFVIFKLKRREDIKLEVEAVNDINETNFKPITEDRLLEIGGQILQMTFLQPPDDEPSLVILVLIVAARGKLQQCVYQWDQSRNISDCNLAPQVHPINPMLVNPLLLVPLKISPGFALVCEQNMGICADVRIKEFGLIAYFSNTDEERDVVPDDPGSSLGTPLYTAWTRPFRHEPYYAKGNDTVYLCREDGFIRLVEFRKTGEKVSSTNTPLGHLRVNVDTAFTSLDHDANLYPGGRGADVLLVGGSMSNGGLFLIKAHQDASLQQHVPNWTPIQDYAVVPERGQIPDLGRDSFLTSRVFACTGKGRRHGSLCEMRYGIEGQVLESIEFENPTHGRAWVLPGRLGMSMIILVSSTQETNLFHYTYDGVDEALGTKEAEWHDFFHTDTPTLYAGRTKDGIYIQIAERRTEEKTETEIRAICWPPSSTQGPSLFEEKLEGLTVISAHVNGDESTIGLVACVEGQYVLLYARLIVDHGNLTFNHSAPMKLKAEPTCVDILGLQTRTIVFVGSRERELLVFKLLEDQGRLVEQASNEAAATHKFGNEDDVCESILVLDKGQHDRASYFIGCGLRSGSLHILKLTMKDGYVLSSLGHFDIGSTAVSVKPDYYHRSAQDKIDNLGAFVLCEDDLYYLELAEHGSLNQESLRPIYLSDENRIGISQASVKDVTQLQPWNCDMAEEVSRYRTFVLLPSEAKILSLKVSAGSTIIPRHIFISGNPSRILYLPDFNKIVVASSHNGVIESTSSTGRSADNVRVSMPTLKVVDPDNPDPSNARLKEEAFEVPTTLPPDRTSFTIDVGRSGLRTTGMSHWQITVTGKRWHYLLVGTAKPSGTNGGQKGRVLVYSIFRASNRTGELTLKYKCKFDTEEAVHSVAGFNERAFVYCAGVDLFLQHVQVDLSDQRLRKANLVSYRIGSIGRSISVRGPVIFVSTAAHSLRAIRISHGDFAEIAVDDVSRETFHHLALTESLVVSSHADGSLSGFYTASNAATSSGFSKAFEAILPAKISCLRKATLRRHAFGSIWTRRIPPILASTFDGTLYEIHVLENAACKLLRFIQDLAEHDKRICPYTWNRSSGRAGTNNWQSLSRPSDRHIDGDILQRMLTYRRRPVQRSLLRDLLCTAHGQYDDQKIQVLRSLASGLIEDETGSEDDLLQAVTRYLRELL